MIKVNEYVKGKVKSLGFEREGVAYTAGVLSPGEYSLDTEREEELTVTVGEYEIRLPGEEWRVVRVGDALAIPAKVTFDLKVQEPASYVCMFK